MNLKKERLGLLSPLLTTALIALTTFSTFTFFPFVVQSSYAQIEGAAFTDDTGFTVDLPPGWIANDYQNTGPQATATENQLGYTRLAVFCESDDTAPRFGTSVGTCDTTSPHSGNWVQVFRYKDFANNPIVSAGTGGMPLSELTAEHVYLYHLEELRRFNDVASTLPGSTEPNIYEEFSQTGFMIPKAGQQEPMLGDMHMIESFYSLFFIDQTTGYAYRVTAGGFDVGEWVVGNRFVEGDAPDAVDKVIYSVRLNNPPPSVTHQLFSYERSSQPDYSDPGAITVATEPAPETPSSSDPMSLLFGPTG